MKKLHLCLLFSLTVLSASSQKVYFIYIQTEYEQPFFVKMNEKIQSSTASGYIILSKLVDSTYSFSIGFPQNKWAEQNFSVSVNKKDHGFLLKNFGEKGWGLFDLQTLAVQMAVTRKASVDNRPIPENNTVSEFTEILSKAADDPSLKEKPAQPKGEEKKTEVVVQDIIKKEEQKAEVKEPEASKPAEVIEVISVKKGDAKTDSKEATVIKPVETIGEAVINKEETKIEVSASSVIKPAIAVEEPLLERKVEDTVQAKDQRESVITEVVTSESFKASQVKKWSESSTTEGFGLVFIDDYDNGMKDTIRLVIPNPKPAVSVIKDEPKEEKKFLDISTETGEKETGKVAQVKPDITLSVTNADKAAHNNNCTELATENDFFKLRKRMAAVESDDDMISEAREYFKEKCFSTEQLKNLGTLFLTDEGKYKFFDASYKYVTDLETFNSLQNELKDEYYLSRFKAMIRN